MKTFKKPILAVSMVFALSGCMGGGSGTNSTQVDINGSVGDGPIAGATVVLLSKSHRVLATTVSDAQASYSFDVTVSEQDFPLIVQAFDGTDLVSGTAPDFTMQSLVESNADSVVNINPHSTLVAKAASVMAGGLNGNNIAAAKTAVMKEFAFGLDESSVADPITTDVDDENVAEMVKASETMAEAVRRTRNSLRSNGSNATADDVINALAADLSDGVLDGEGAAATDARTTAVAAVASAQVLVEAMENKLKVNGKVATTAMDRAIQTIEPAAKKRTRDVRVTEEMVEQANDSLTVAESVSGAASVKKVKTALKKVKDNSTASSADATLPDNAASTLETALRNVSKADDSKVKTALRSYASTWQGTAITPVTDSDGDSGSDSGSNSNTGGTKLVDTATESTVTLNWSSPEQRTNGDSLSLSELDGYRIYYGTNPNQLKALVDINEGDATKHSVKLEKGKKYFFAITAYDTSGRESGRSNVMSTSI